MKVRAVVVLVLAGTALAVPATSASAAACAQDRGVTLLVEFNSLGGGTQTRCAAGNPDSGLTALRAAGFTSTRAAQQPGYFLCRIDGKPANDPCQRTSPADAYWSYWHAKPGGSWTYSDTGPADFDPAPGTVEGWAFGAGKPPRAAPPRGEAAAAPTPSRPASPSAPTSARTTTNAVASPVVSSPRPSPSPAAVPTAPTSGRPAPAAALSSPTPSPSASANTTKTAVRVVRLDRGIGIGIGFGTLGGLVLLAALSLAGAVQWGRRRRDGR